MSTQCPSDRHLLRGARDQRSEEGEEGVEEEKLVEEKEAMEEEEVDELASSFLAMGACTHSRPCTLSKAFLGLLQPEVLPQACSDHFSDPGT